MRVNNVVESNCWQTRLRKPSFEVISPLSTPQPMFEGCSDHQVKPVRNVSKGDVIVAITIMEAMRNVLVRMRMASFVST